jgi:riboflavin biosynthesis pyrimidine reductase
MKAWALAQPLPDERRLVRRVVVEDQVNVELRRDGLVDRVEELTKLHRTVAAMTASDDGARLDIQGREERRRAMANVVVGAPFDLAGTHHRLKTTALAPPVPPAALDHLRAAAVRSAAQSLQIGRDLAQILQALDRRGIPAIVLKGGHLGQVVYESFALRTMCDLDIMVMRDDLTRAADILAGLGFTDSTQVLAFDLHLNRTTSLANVYGNSGAGSWHAGQRDANTGLYLVRPRP